MHPLAFPLVSTPAPAEILTCALCGQACTDVDGGRGWLHLEITREQPVEDLHWWSVDFCSQAHAAEWLQQPMPDPVTGSPSERTGRDRLADAGCFALFLLLVGLVGLGAWTVVQFLVGLF